MSSFPRRLQRKRLRQSADYAPKAQLTIVHKDGGYSTLHPTKGWVRVSGKRVAARLRMAQLLRGNLR